MSLTDILDSLIGLFLNNSYWKQQQLILRRSLCTGFNSTLLHSSDTCEDLTQSGEVEESSLGHGEQLAQEHQKGDRGENHGEDHQDLHRLQPLWGKKKKTWIQGSLAFYGGCFFGFVLFYQFLWRMHTAMFLWSCQTCSCTTGLSSPDCPTPTRTGTENEAQRSSVFSRRAYPDQHQMSNLITTFSMVAMNSMARVIRCSRITDISRYAIFNSLQTKAKLNMKILRGEKKVDFIVSALSQNTNLKIGMTERSVLCAGCTQTHLFFFLLLL